MGSWSVHFSCTHCFRSPPRLSLPSWSPLRIPERGAFKALHGVDGYHRPAPRLGVGCDYLTLHYVYLRRLFSLIPFRVDFSDPVGVAKLLCMSTPFVGVFHVGCSLLERPAVFAVSTPFGVVSVGFPVGGGSHCLVSPLLGVTIL